MGFLRPYTILLKFVVRTRNGSEDVRSVGRRLDRLLLLLRSLSFSTSAFRDFDSHASCRINRPLLLTFSE